MFGGWRSRHLWRDALRSRPPVLYPRPRRSVALQTGRTVRRRPRRSVALHVRRMAVKTSLEGHAAVASLALPTMAVQSPAPNAATTERGPPCSEDGGQGIFGGTRSVASASTWHTATTERGPPNHPVTCAQNAHKLRRKGLMSFPGRPRREPTGNWQPEQRLGNRTGALQLAVLLQGGRIDCFAL